MKPTRLQPIDARPLPSDYPPGTTIAAIARRWRALGWQLVSTRAGCALVRLH